MLRVVGGVIAADNIFCLVTSDSQPDKSQDLVIINWLSWTQDKYFAKIFCRHVCTWKYFILVQFISATISIYLHTRQSTVLQFFTNNQLGHHDSLFYDSIDFYRFLTWRHLYNCTHSHNVGSCRHKTKLIDWGLREFVFNVRV